MVKADASGGTVEFEEKKKVVPLDTKKRTVRNKSRGDVPRKTAKP